MLSPDEDFLQEGVNSKIKYAVAFDSYKEMIIGGWDTITYQRIVAELDASLFGIAPSLNDEIAADDGDHRAEMEAFNRALRAEEAAEAKASLTPLPPSPVTSIPQPLDPHVSISVTMSHILHTIAASSQVSNEVLNVFHRSSSPPEQDEEEPPPQQ